MAVKVTESYICDLCESEIDDKPDPTQVGWDGKVYTLDLCAECDANVTKTMEGIALKGRDIGRYPASTALPATQRAPKTSSKRSSSESAKVRAWAAAQGVEVQPTGRIPKSVMAQYKAASAKNHSNGNGGSRRKQPTAA